MPEEIQEEEIKKEERLLKVLAIVTEWLKFAEAKNAMLIAFNAASIYGSIKLFDIKVVQDNTWMQYYLVIVIALLIFGTVICLLSFVPRLKLISSAIYKEGESINSLFFEHLRTRTDVQIIQDVCETKEESFSRFETDIANQVKQNSEIASKKLAYFTVAIWMTVASYVTIVVAFFFWVYTYRHRNA